MLDVSDRLANQSHQAGTAPRRTFAIISHPDAGKTTLTEKLLLFGGAIQMAGQVRARGDRRRTRSDWLEIERARGISVTSSVMTFEHAGMVFNLLDTPGHADFSEDTYRTLTAVDAAVMVIDAAKGIESQTRKLFEVCRLRNILMCVYRKIDREGHDRWRRWMNSPGRRRHSLSRESAGSISAASRHRGRVASPHPACTARSTPGVDSVRRRIPRRHPGADHAAGAGKLGSASATCRFDPRRSRRPSRGDLRQRAVRCGLLDHPRALRPDC